MFVRILKTFGNMSLNLYVSLCFDSCHYQRITYEYLLSNTIQVFIKFCKSKIHFVGKKNTSDFIKCVITKLTFQKFDNLKLVMWLHLKCYIWPVVFLYYSKTCSLEKTYGSHRQSN